MSNINQQTDPGSELKNCPHYPECRQEYISFLRPGNLCKCYEQARAKWLLQQAQIPERHLLAERPEEFGQLDITNVPIIVYAPSIGQHTDAIVKLLASEISFETRGLLLDYDQTSLTLGSREFSEDVLQEKTVLGQQILECSLLALVGIDSGSRRSPHLKALLFARMQRFDRPTIFGVVGDALESLDEGVQTMISIYHTAVPIFV